jgi:hypothetical protein
VILYLYIMYLVFPSFLIAWTNLQTKVRSHKS